MAHQDDAPRPNLILITTDQQRFDAMGLNNPDSPLRTLNLDRLAAAGVNFNRAYSTCPVCIPARRSILTGLHPHTHGLGKYQDGIDWDPPFTLPGLLGEAGYQTELLGKLHLYPQRKRYGFDHMIRSETPNDRRASTMMPVNDYIDDLEKLGLPFNPNGHGLSGNGRSARPFQLNEEYHQSSWLADKAVEFLTQKRDPTCPYFLHLSFWAPHPPLIPPQAYWDRYQGMDGLEPRMSGWTPNFGSPEQFPRGISVDSPTGPFAPAEIADAIAGYYGLIHHLDDRIGFVLDRLFEYGSPRAKDPTYILFTSDHGEMLGDHHLFRKGLPYEPSAHVPLFLSGHNVDLPGGLPTSSNALASLEDIAPTMLDLANVEIPEQLAQPLEGKSLAGCLSEGEGAAAGQVHPRQTLFGECGGKFPHHYLIEGPLKYVWFGRTGEEQLFDLEADPHEQTDISDQRNKLTGFRAKLADHLRTREDYEFDESALSPCENQPPKALWGEP